MTNIPFSLRAYLGATHLAPVIAKRHLRKRVTRGKEHPTRWTEKLGHPTADRPAGQLIWLHAVGLGEVLSLRGLITAMATKTDAHFLVTSSTRAGADVLSKNTPPRTIHQFLPLDAPQYRKLFLDHWQPDLCIWAEQDIWPGFVHDLSRRTIPQTIVAARMNVASMNKRRKLAELHRWLYAQMALITAQDAKTRDNLLKSGAKDVTITGSLKPTAPPLNCNPTELASLQAALKDRLVWITAPSHAADEDIAIAAHKHLLKTHHDALLIIAPRFPDRTIASDLPTAIRSKNETPNGHHAIYLADTFGDLGLLYRLANAVLIGGTHDATEGHSPWEAAILQTAILHGPHTDHFKNDYSMLHDANAAIHAENPVQIAQTMGRDMSPYIANATRLIATQHTATEALADQLVTLT